MNTEIAEEVVLPERKPETPEERRERLRLKFEAIRKPSGWVDELKGCMNDVDPDVFEEVMRLGREWRAEQNLIKDQV